MIPALENVALWHERDISHSSVERAIAPDTTIHLDFALRRLAGVMERLVVYPENMLKNLDRLGGLVHSQRVLLALTQKGVAREVAYAAVQRNAMKVWRGEGAFLDLLKADPEVTLPEAELAELFDLAYSLSFQACGHDLRPRVRGWRAEQAGKAASATLEDLSVALSLALPGAHEVTYKGDPWFNVGKKSSSRSAPTAAPSFSKLDPRSPGAPVRDSPEDLPEMPGGHGLLELGRTRSPRRGRIGRPAAGSLDARRAEEDQPPVAGRGEGLKRPICLRGRFRGPGPRVRPSSSELRPR